MDDINQTIHDIYKHTGFLDTYLIDVFITFILCIVFFVAISYFYVMNNIKPIVANWENEKFSPAVIPFAGLINNGPNTTKFEFTANNFAACLHTMVTVLTNDVMQPILYIMSLFAIFFADLKEVMNKVRAELNKVRIAVDQFTTDAMNRILNVIMPIIEMMIGVKTMLAKVTGVIAASAFTLIGAMISIRSTLTFMMNVINDILLALVITILATIVIAIFFPPVFEVAVGMIIIMTLILIPSIMIEHFMDEVLNLQSPTFPGIPSCFAKNTLIKMADGTEKMIGDILLGDLLENNDRVSAILKCSARGQTMYELDGVLVTGEHRVFNKEKGWIKVKDDENSRSIPQFADPYVYCLTTDSKTIKINNTVFSDWDDVDEDVLEHLETKCVAKGLLLPEFNGKDLHMHLANGLDGDVSYVQTKNGNLIPLKDIQVNDILNEGQRVVAIIKIDMSDIDIVYDYSFSKAGKPLEKTFIRSCRNLQTFNKDSTKNWIEFKENKDFTPLDRTNHCYYQLLVEGGRYMVNGVMIGDYNTGIDKFLL